MSKKGFATVEVHLDWVLEAKALVLSATEGLIIEKRRLKEEVHKLHEEHPTKGWERFFNGKGAFSKAANKGLQTALRKSPHWDKLVAFNWGGSGDKPSIYFNKTGDRFQNTLLELDAALSGAELSGREVAVFPCSWVKFTEDLKND